jgi:hypothetical protein
LGDVLRHRIFVYVGTHDNYYLNEGVMKFEQNVNSYGGPGWVRTMFQLFYTRGIIGTKPLEMITSIYGQSNRLLTSHPGQRHNPRRQNPRRQLPNSRDLELPRVPRAALQRLRSRRRNSSKQKPHHIRSPWQPLGRSYQLCRTPGRSRSPSAACAQCDWPNCSCFRWTLGSRRHA